MRISYFIARAAHPFGCKDSSAFAREPLVAGDFGLRFYAGVPLRTSDGYNLGTLCVIDKPPRPIDQGQIDDLKDLASVVMDQLELRLSARQALSKAEIMAREIDHRVMNSLQFISSFLVMQSRTQTWPLSPQMNCRRRQPALRRSPVYIAIFIRMRRPRYPASLLSVVFVQTCRIFSANPSTCMAMKATCRRPAFKRSAFW